MEDLVFLLGFGFTRPRRRRSTAVAVRKEALLPGHAASGAIRASGDSGVVGDRNHTALLAVELADVSVDQTPTPEALLAADVTDAHFGGLEWGWLVGWLVVLYVK